MKSIIAVYYSVLSVDMNNRDFQTQSRSSLSSNSPQELQQRRSEEWKQQGVEDIQDDWPYLVSEWDNESCESSSELQIVDHVG